MTKRALVTVVALLAVLALGLSYLLIAVVQIDPFSHPIRVTVNLARSGGLLGYSQVTYLGHPVGRISGIALRAGGVRVSATLEQGTKIPVNTDVVIADLSAVGEQYLDFQPRTDQGPYLADGAVIDQQDTHTPVPFSQVIADVTRLTNQVDPAKVTVVVDELAKAFNGSGPDIQRILDGGDLLLAGLDGVLPQTVDLLHSGRIVLGTVSDLHGELMRFSGDGRDFTSILRESDPQIRDLLDDAPKTLDLIDDVVRKDGPDIGLLLGDLATTTQVVALRLPAISQFLPELDNFGPIAVAVVKDRVTNVLWDLTPRPNCSYGTPRRPPTIDGSPPPRIYRYCTQTGPQLQQRGSTNVPRRRGDDTAGPPPGANPEQRAGAPRDSDHN